MRRSIIYIHEELCNGCGVCIDSCHEGAIELAEGKAKLISDIYCDGLGACLPNCPTGAIEIIEREADDFDEAAVEKRMEEMQGRLTADEALAPNSAGGRKPDVAQPVSHSHHRHGQTHGHHHHGMGGCPGSMSARIDRTPDRAEAAPPSQYESEAALPGKQQSELQQWPVQIALVNPAAPFFQDADLLVAADCSAYAYADFHRDFIRNHITVIGCPKLDDNEYYAKKLAEILKTNRIKSITVTRMAVPCCGGIVHAVKQAMLESRTIVPYREVTVGIDGQLVQ